MKNKSWIKILLTPIFLICFGVIGNAQTSAPHLNQYLHRDTDGDLPYRKGNLYNFLPDRAVIDDDFYGAYGIDVSSLTPLKRKMLEESEEFKTRWNKWQNFRASMRDTLCHVKYSSRRPVYDLDKGGFKISLDISERGLGLFIPQKLSNKLRIDKDENLTFFVPIRNLDEALKIEETGDYEYAVQFYYFPIDHSAQQYYYKSNLSDLIFKVHDVFLYRRSTGEIVWSALLGDQSEKLSTDSNASNGSYSLASPDEIFKAVEQPAEFPGGASALTKWLSNNIRYPDVAQQNNIQGRVVVRFIVEKDGSISSAKVVKGVDKDLDAEALRVVKKMPKWEPGKNNGVAVRSYFTLPVTFGLQNQ